MIYEGIPLTNLQTKRASLDLRTGLSARVGGQDQYRDVDLNGGLARLSPSRGVHVRYFKGSPGTVFWLKMATGPLLRELVPLACYQ